jgi:hypothetical protein
MPRIPRASYPVCPICSEHVELESANTDEKGNAVHEECYVSLLLLQPFNRPFAALPVPDSTFADAIAILARTPGPIAGYLRLPGTPLKVSGSRRS